MERTVEYFMRRLERPKSYLLSSARARAKRDGLEFSITSRDFEIPSHCPLLGIPLDYTPGRGQKGKWVSPSLDRIDNTKGYVKGNVWVISTKANHMKCDVSWDELVTFALSVLDHTENINVEREVN